MSSLVLSAAWAGARAMLKVALVCGIGGLAFKLNIFDQPTSKVMSKMFIQLYLPLLIFSKTALAITPENVPFLALITAFALTYFVLGHVFGLVLYFTVRNAMPVHLRLSLIPAAAFGNNGDLVLSIIMSLGGIAPFKDGDVDRGIAYVSFWYAIFNLIFYAASINFFKSDFDQLAKQHDQVFLQSSSYLAHDSCPPTPQSPPPSLSAVTLPLNRFHRFLLAAYSHPVSQSILLPPNIALGSGLLIALVPGLKSLFFPLATAPLSFVFDAAEFMGQAAVPISMTIFGAALTTFELDRSVLRQYPGLVWSSVALLLFRLFLLPAIGISLCQWATSLGWVPIDQPMLRFVIMVQACVPTAQICILITQYYHPRGESKEMATLMIIQYIVAMFSLTACLGFIFHLVSTAT